MTEPPGRAHGVLIRRVITWVGAYWAGGGEALHGENQTPRGRGILGFLGLGKLLTWVAYGQSALLQVLYKCVWML